MGLLLNRIEHFPTHQFMFQFQLTVPISVVFAKGVLFGDQERKLPFRKVQEMETPLNRKLGTTICR